MSGGFTVTSSPFVEPNGDPVYVERVRVRVVANRKSACRQESDLYGHENLQRRPKGEEVEKKLKGKCFLRWSCNKLGNLHLYWGINIDLQHFAHKILTYIFIIYLSKV